MFLAVLVHTNVRLLTWYKNTTFKHPIVSATKGEPTKLKQPDSTFANCLEIDTSTAGALMSKYHGPNLAQKFHNAIDINCV